MHQRCLFLPCWQVTRSLALTILALILVGLTPWQVLAATHPYTRAQGTHAAATGSTVYVGSDDSAFYAFNATTGAPFWKYVTGGSVFSSPSSVVNGLIYVGSYDHAIYAFQANTGALAWKYATGGMVHSSPRVASNGLVYVGSDDHSLYALNASTGALAWRFLTGNAVESTPTVAVV